MDKILDILNVKKIVNVPKLQKSKDRLKIE